MTLFKIIAGLFVLFLGFKLIQDVTMQDWLGDHATAIAKPIVGQVLNLVNAPPFTYIASLTIVVSAILLCVLYWIRRVAPQIRALIAIRKTLDSTNFGFQTGAANWQDFASRIGATFVSHPTLLHAWTEYVHEADRSLNGNTRSFSDRVSSGVLNRHREEAGLMSALPGYYTSVGLILTFIGLVVALYFAAKGFRSGGMDEARASIIQLLNASAFKFLTSVSALVSALLISVVHRFLNDMTTREALGVGERVDAIVAQWRALTGGKGLGSLSENQTTQLMLAAIAELNSTVRELSAVVSKMNKGPR